jgi:intracellular sulfur oxidation DsrE/DsrF family protein
MSELEVKRGRGRPENNDNEVLTDILNDESKRKEFVEAIENLVFHKRKIEADMLLHKEAVSAVSEKFGLSKGLLNKKVTAIVKDKESDEADKALTLHGLLTEV